MNEDSGLPDIGERMAVLLREERDLIARALAARRGHVAGIFDASGRFSGEDHTNGQPPDDEGSSPDPGPPSGPVPEEVPSESARPAAEPLVDPVPSPIPTGMGVDEANFLAELFEPEPPDRSRLARTEIGRLKSDLTPDGRAGKSMSGGPDHQAGVPEDPVPVDPTEATLARQKAASDAAAQPRGSALWPPGTTTTVVHRPPLRSPAPPAPSADVVDRRSPPPPPGPSRTGPPPISPQDDEPPAVAVRARPGPAPMAAVRLPVGDRLRTAISWTRTVGLARVPDTRAADLAPSRRRIARIALWARNVGAVMVLFVIFQLWGTGFSQARSQDALRAEFARSLALNTPLAAPDGTGPAVATSPQAGGAVARIRIPAIGVDQVVVQGTDVGDLRKGPGHYLNTPFPGEPGNAAIAGHRTTFGAPFSRLDDLRSGDPITVTTTRGTFGYMVDKKTVVKPAQDAVLANRGGNLLTLTTCTPKYSAAQRLVVVATLSTAPVAARGPASGDPPHPNQGGDHSAWVPTILWGTLAGLVVIGTRRLAVNWTRLPALAMGVPLALVVLFECFQSLNLGLPANF